MIDSRPLEEVKLSRNLQTKVKFQLYQFLLAHQQEVH